VELYPAVDIHHGKAVRLTQGDFDRVDDFGAPLELARSYAAAGARWIHVVDLDAARTGTPVHRDLVLAICDEVDAMIQVGGGIRSQEDAAALIDGGAARVVLGTAAVTDPGLVAELAAHHPGQVVVGIDHRAGVDVASADVAVQGWEAGSGSSVDGVLAALQAVDVAAVILTAIERDGTLSGPDLAGLTAVLGSTRHDVIASGGVRSAADLAALGALRSSADRRLAGVVVGRAIVDGTLPLEEAIVACEASG
jgi:phosphoribosylformimino-5-aminoimidazole carboxamide ribotide isomerase